jgi:ABC-type nitrate/sulfonate/bicarbonate transport system substrate-binding protein
MSDKPSGHDAAGPSSPTQPGRRRLVSHGAALAAAASLAPALLLPSIAASATSFSEWGWPQPYERISSKSVEWLKSKGWWPLQVAWNPLWSDGNLVLFTMQHYKLLQQRGVEAEFPAFLAAAFMNETFVPGKIQIAQAGSLGLLRIIDLKVPAAAVTCYPAQRQAFLVPLDSPLKSLADLKGQKVLGRPAVWAVTVGSTTHLGMLIAAKVLGLEENKDYVLRNVGPNDIITMPKGIDVTAIWEPNVLLMTEFRKNARILELIDSYEVFNGYSYIRGEIEQNAPDVIQAYVDAFVEARLIARLKQKEVIDAFAAHPSQRGRDVALIARDAEIHVFNPKPTLSFPFENTEGFWIPLETYQAGVMADANVLKRRYTDADFKEVLRPRYMQNTYAKLGWNVPKKPAFLPADWSGKAGKPPYPPYGMMHLGPQQFPESGDLARDWTFAGKTYRP